MIRFTVWGDPVPQGSKRAFVNKYTGRAQIVDQSGARLKEWRKAIIDEAREFDEDFNGGPVEVKLVFSLHKPKKPKYDRPTVRPDVDKLARGVLDALQAAGTFVDDAQVVRLLASKWYAEDDAPNVLIEVKSWQPKT